MNGPAAAMHYLDHAATSHPKPPAVRQAMLDWFEHFGVSADRGDSTTSRVVAERLAALRRAVGRLVGVPADRVAFVSGATEGLNLALRALLRPGDRVVTTAFEHSSMARPLRALATERNLTIDVLPAEANGGLGVDSLRAALQAPARLVAFTHASNVTGAVLDAAAFTTIARQRGALTLLDACQTAGLLPLDLGADVVVASGHKALQGPPGTGFVSCRPGLDLAPQKQGGTGGSHALDVHPTAWPRAFEAGTPNTPALFGLAAALDRLADHPPAENLARALARLDALIAGLEGTPGLHLLRPAGARVPILSLVHDTFDAAELGAILDGNGVVARSGFHCAPWLHTHLGTSVGGTLRLSPGPDTDAATIAAAVAALRSLGA